MRKLIKRLVLLALLGAVAFVAAYFVYPDVGEYAKKNPDKTAFMLWREEQWAEKGLKKRITQRWVPISQVSPALLKAVLIGEDDKFYQHEGFDFDAMEQAMEKNMKAGRFKAGASTISQQLTKNLFLSPEKSLTRKFKEAILTWRLERALSKRRILELYVNVAEWGDGIFGIEAAARHYFHKPASQLSTMEAARLAAVLPNPIRFVATSDQKYVTFRAGLIHSIMVRRGIAIDDFQEVMDTKDEPGVEAGNGAGNGATQPAAASGPAGQAPPTEQERLGARTPGTSTPDATEASPERLAGRTPAQGQPAPEPGAERLGGRMPAAPVNPANPYVPLNSAAPAQAPARP
ncbi:MAG: monofunctional biosynthetic peptidoglycan transglycosylase [Humidesulfovibrio sp.]|uniref:monofunctional biosynthetic peptidoglycan transglycosylase n=1 Tax=Humidesulfovibrio sp. TaxID=2910988 RepID=UPI0027E9166C|nr:monofunctional biosynthetic peptidoglycan transglycosylase [Humidesulfovibrio sp.]MDQ7836761.1 monofunctional biosynthetic peptidoglycan transglycosylase [Humidesulfovibrio sp.]